MRVLIVGATGGTGRQLVRLTLEAGHEVTVLARKPAKVRSSHAKLRVVQGDVLDYATVEAAVRGQEAVLCALGHKRWLYPTRILSMGTANLVRAMQANGVRRLVCETSLGLGESWGRMGLYYTFFVIPFILPFYYWDKRRQERVVRASALDWVIVRPGALTNGKQRGSYRHGAGVGNWLWTVWISRSDVAEFMLRQLETDHYLRSAPGVAYW